MSAPANIAVAGSLRFQIGARTVFAVSRRLLRVAWSLDDVLAGRVRRLPSLGGVDGCMLTSVPEAIVGTIPTAGLVTQVRQHYRRYYVDFTIGHDAWQASLSANTRQTLRRKARRLGEYDTPDIRGYRTPEEVTAFHELARPLSALTYQERLLDAGLPDSPAARAIAGVLAADDAIRAWLLFYDGKPIAYLYCGAEGDTLRYDHVGHDPAYSQMSPGSVLMAEALRRLFDDRFTRFDFTEGEGQHKRQFATGSEACVDLLLLRPTLVNRLTVGALAAFDRAVARAKQMAQRGLAKRLGDRIRRA